jgi:ubiquinone/menaquinone biosynthesis C-methylase UbiE
MSTVNRGLTQLQRGSDEAFGGLIGREYEMLKLICPAAADMSRQVGVYAGAWTPPQSDRPAGKLKIIEIGCGTGITTSALLHARDDAEITAVDLEATMLEQARRNLSGSIESGRLVTVESDALSFLKGLPDAGVDMIASGYAFHNFRDEYRNAVVGEMFRVLRPGGVFVNGDRYALDDPLEQLKVVQDELRQYFEVFARIKRPDMLEQWVIHLFSDESPDHVMRLASALSLYRAAGFDPVHVHDRYQNNAVVSAEKPLA